MQPKKLRKSKGLVRPSASVLFLCSAMPAHAQTGQGLVGAAATPMALALGAAALGMLALGLILSARSRGRAIRQQAAGQIASMRALLDQYESALAGWQGVTIVWDDGGRAPRILGQAGSVLPPGRSIDAALDFSVWLGPSEADALGRAVAALRVEGRRFDFVLATRDKRRVRATGWPTGIGAAMRLRPVAPVAPEAAEAGAAPGTALPDRREAEAILVADPEPAFLRDGGGRLVFANAAYRRLTASAGAGETGPIPELLDAPTLRRHLDAVEAGGRPRLVRVNLPDRQAFDLIEAPIPGGTVGFLRPRGAAPAAPAGTPASGHIAGIIDALATPVAIFDARRELIHFNAAYAALWSLDPEWLRTRPDERDILDRLRTAGQLPAEPNYQEWRDRHLTSYRLTAPRVSEPWHLPDGRTIVITAAPAGPQGGVVYVFEDMTARLELESRNRALANVQRETLNALSEGVAVFGTNGRLTLFNPRLSSLWKLPVNALAGSPHIDAVTEMAADAIPEDGARIWRDLKRRIIDLNPNRSDDSGRISRADGRLLDWALVRLPDGQTLLTFLDVTESANYSRVLKERNEALITADRLKDAFVQNVSYELRSPLTNIIGFADLLASGTAGPLNERQRAYTDYIRSSSETLGVLIDNILDLATVDAGIAELNPEPQDVRALVDKARAGLAASFPKIDGESRLNLKVDIAPDLPAFTADGTRLVQILYNLLSNAARFSQPGGEVRLTVRSRNERMLFIVEDEGTLMSEQMKAAMADQGDLLAGRRRGAGLGLAIVRSFVSLHGGTISVEPREPRGTRIIVSLPLDAGAALGAAE